MSKWIKIAFRNIIKNRRRSFVTLVAIAVGFSAVIFFGGYKHRAYWGIRIGAIRGEGLGHLTIYKKGWLEKGYADPARYMFDQKEIQQIIDLNKKEAAVLFLHIYLVGGGISAGTTGIQTKHRGCLGTCVRTEVQETRCRHGLCGTGFLTTDFRSGYPV